jgi:hypothetical protein
VSVGELLKSLQVKGHQLALTETPIRALKPQAKPYKVTDEKGLYLLAAPPGGKLWKRTFLNGMKAEKNLSLGS